MEYIDKDALVAWAKETYLCKNASMIRKVCYKQLLEHLNTLQMKEVDLDSEHRKYLTKHFNVYEDGILQSKRSNLPLDIYDVIKLAKHFFELGISVSNKA